VGKDYFPPTQRILKTVVFTAVLRKITFRDALKLLEHVTIHFYSTEEKHTNLLVMSLIIFCNTLVLIKYIIVFLSSVMSNVKL
jgi:hypothetical protein